MEKLFDIIFWLLDNPEKVKKIQILFLVVLLIGIIGYAVILTIGIPELIGRIVGSPTGES